MSKTTSCEHGTDTFEFTCTWCLEDENESLRAEVETLKAERDAALTRIDILENDLADLLHAAKCFLGALDFGDGVTRLEMRKNLETIIARIEDN